MNVSELVTIEKIKSWGAGDTITIKAGTGAGKSYFIKNNLHALAKKENKKILMLIHRTDCVNQFIQEIKKDKKTDVIDIMTYQKLEQKFLKSKKDIDLSEYQYIVSDEFHYFMGDAAFSNTTDISLDIILDQRFAIKIFMSATGDHMKEYINDNKKIKTIDYELPISYSFIKSLTFFNLDSTLEDLMETAIKRNDKAIFFIQSARKAYELYKAYKEHCIFNCSKHNSSYFKYVDQQKINTMLEKQKFDDLILITTTCMDTGVNINDTDLKHIVCDVEDTGTLIQCIGRKRLKGKKDKIYLYIRNIGNKSLGNKKGKLKEKSKMAEFLKTHTVQEFILEYQRKYDINKVVYNAVVKEKDKGTLKVNDLMFFKYKTDLKEIEEILSYGKKGYCKYIKNLFGLNSYRTIEEDYETSQLEKYLNKLIGKKLYKEKQKELAERADIKRNGKLMKSCNSLNACFVEEDIPFGIELETDWARKLDNNLKNPNYGKVFWTVFKKNFWPRKWVLSCIRTKHPKTWPNFKIKSLKTIK